MIVNKTSPPIGGGGHHYKIPGFPASEFSQLKDG
jgi:hypothetical protein